jgi:hypothetical protein
LVFGDVKGSRNIQSEAHLVIKFLMVHKMRQYALAIVRLDDSPYSPKSLTFDDLNNKTHHKIKTMLRLAIFSFLSRLMKVLLPKIYKQPDLSQLSKFHLLVVGIKLWITYNYLEAKGSG